MIERGVHKFPLAERLRDIADKFDHSDVSSFILITLEGDNLVPDGMVGVAQGEPREVYDKLLDSLTRVHAAILELSAR